MTSIRYIITRSCLQDGSMRLLKFNEGHFPRSGPVLFIDQHGKEHQLQVDRERMRVTGLGGFYHDLNLGVNDVMMITPLAQERYQVEVIVKPHPIGAPARPAPAPLPETRRVVVASTPHVREVRLQTQPVSGRAPVSSEQQSADPARDHERPDPLLPLRSEAGRTEQLRTEQARADHSRTDVGANRSSADPLREVAALYSAPEGAGREASAPEAAPLHMAPETDLPVTPTLPRAAAPSSPRPAPAASGPSRPEDQIAEFAHLTGYRLEYPATGLMRLTADLGSQYGYSVLIAADPLAMSQPAWTEAGDEARFLMTHEAERPEGVSRLTREALGVLLDHAHLAPLSPVEMRGYWRSGSIDMQSAASITELVSAHLAQRGTFTFVMMSLAAQPANSIVNVKGLAERLGSGVNKAELSTILETLARPPFLALMPLPGGQYLLRTEVGRLLSDLAEYSMSVRRRTDGAGSTAEAAYASVGAPASSAAKVHH